MRTFYVHTRIFEKKKVTFYVASGKKTKICPVNSHMLIHKFVLFIPETKNVLFYEFFLRVCPDVYANFCSGVFDILKYVFR
jgi:hypothetical protein